MKTLNRTLSLVLVLVMVLGLFGVASAKFTDDTSIQYKEAVGVMTGIGAINGMGDGNFAPKGNVTRAQAAKMVAYTVLGKDVAEKLSVSKSSFKDVGADLAWATPSIEYLVSRNIINGMGDGTFNPNGNVTGYQLAKMLLVALGVKGEFTGESWELNTAIAANKAGIFKDSKAASYIAAATREEAALYCFNTLFYGEKVTKTATKYVLTADSAADAAVIALSGNLYDSFNAAKLAATAADAGSVYGTDYTVTSISVTEETIKDSIADDVYDLAKVTGTNDAFGRPATTYSMDSKTIAQFAKAPVATFTNAFTKGALYTALGENVASIPVTKSSEAAQTAGAALVAQVGLNGVADYQGGNGVITEIYKTGTSTYVAIQIVPQLGKISAIAPTKATSTAGAYATYAVTDGVTPLTGRVYSTVVDKDVDKDTAVITGAVAVDAPVLYYKDANNKVYIQAVGTLSGVLSSVSSSNILTIDGKPHQMAEAGTLPSASTKSQNFLVDSYGYILKSVTATVGTNFGLVLQEKTVYTQQTDGTLKPTNVVVVAAADGTVQTLPVVSLPAPALVGKLVTYAVNPSVTTATVYTVTNVAADDANKDFASHVTSITNKYPALGVGDAVANTPATTATAKYADASTIFVLANYADGVPTGTVTTYTGIANVPSYTGLTTGDAYAVDTATVKDGVANVVFIYKDVNASSSSKLVYLVGTYNVTATAKVYDAIINGQPATITVAKNNTALDSQGGKLFKSITVDSVGVPTATALDNTEGLVTGAIGVKVSGGLVYTTTNGTDFAVNTFPVATPVTSAADGTPVFVFHAASRTVDTLTAATAGTVAGASAAVYVVPNTSAPTTAAAIYVILAD